MYQLWLITISEKTSRTPKPYLQSWKHPMSEVQSLGYFGESTEQEKHFAACRAN